jgi:putative membrane protein
MMKKISAFSLPVVAALLMLACAGDASDGGKKSDGFAKAAAQGGMAEVQMGKLATERGGSAVVKLFGQRMVDDHTKANMELNQLAARKNIQLPQELSADQKSMMDKLSKLAGEDFDKQYVDMMVDDHEHDVAEFQTQSEKGDDPDVRAFAAKTLPTLRDHLQMIKDIKSKL